jgi:hypothetical protein
VATHAVAADASVSAAEFDALPFRTVADAATGKRDFALLAAPSDTSADDHDTQAVNIFRPHVYTGGQYSRRLSQLSTELRHALIVLAERSPIPGPHVRRRLPSSGRDRPAAVITEIG